MFRQRRKWAVMAVGFAAVLCVSLVRPSAAQERALQTISLFNGENLLGWVNVNCAPGTWQVRDGVIYCTGKPRGILRTQNMYENYVLELDWRHLKPKGNAGLFVHSDALPQVGAPFSRSIEVQIMDGDHGSMFGIRGATCTPITNPRGKLRAQPTENRVHPGGTGEWNHYILTSKDGALDLEVNGKLVTQLKDCVPRKGYICLESEGGEAEFRNIKITPTGSPPLTSRLVAQADAGYVSMFDGLDFDGWRLPRGSVDHWVATDGLIKYDGKSQAEGDEKNLWTEKKYKDFSMIIDWRLPRKPELTKRPTFSKDGDRLATPTQDVMDAGDSGIYLRGSSKSQINIWCQPMGSGEVHGYVTDKNLPVEIRRALMPSKKADNPPGQWNRFEITMRGDRLTVVLNGETVIDNAPLPGVAPEGRIALQHHTDPVEFRNIYIKSLD